MSKTDRVTLSAWLPKHTVQRTIVFLPINIYLFKMFRESILVVTVGTPYAYVLIHLQRSNSVTLWVISWCKGLWFKVDLSRMWVCVWLIKTSSADWCHRSTAGNNGKAYNLLVLLFAHPTGIVYTVPARLSWHQWRSHMIRSVLRAIDRLGVRSHVVVRSAVFGFCVKSGSIISTARAICFTKFGSELSEQCLLPLACLIWKTSATVLAAFSGG